MALSADLRARVEAALQQSMTEVRDLLGRYRTALDYVAHALEAKREMDGQCIATLLAKAIPDVGHLEATGQSLPVEAHENDALDSQQGA